MKKVTQITTAVILSVVISTPALADSTPVPAVPEPIAELSTDELAYAFGDNAQNLQLAAMSVQEMEETQGAWSLQSVVTSSAVIGGLQGAGVAHWRYLGSAAVTGDFDVADYAHDVAIGGVVGAGLGAYQGSVYNMLTYYGLSRGLAIENAVYEVVKEVVNNE